MANALWISATNPRALAQHGITCSIATAQNGMQSIHHATIMVARIHGANERAALHKANAIVRVGTNRAGDPVWQINRHHVQELTDWLIEEKCWISTSHGEALAALGITSASSTIHAAAQQLHSTLRAPHLARGMAPDLADFLASRKGIRHGISLWGNPVYQVHSRLIPRLTQEIETVAQAWEAPEWVNARNHSRLLEFGITSKSDLVEKTLATIHARDVSSLCARSGISEEAAQRKVHAYLRPARTESGTRSWAVRADYLANIAHQLCFDPRQSHAWLSPMSSQWKALNVLAGRPVIERAMLQLSQSDIPHEAALVREGTAQEGKITLKAHRDAAPLLAAIIEAMPHRERYNSGKSSSRPSL